MNLLKFADLKGRAGVWAMYGTNHAQMKNDFLVQDGRGGCWHANQTGYCCNHKHTEYFYATTNRNWRSCAPPNYEEKKPALKRRLLLL